MRSTETQGSSARLAIRPRKPQRGVLFLNTGGGDNKDKHAQDATVRGEGRLEHKDQGPKTTTEEEKIGNHHSQIKNKVFRLISSLAERGGDHAELKDEALFISALKLTPEEEQSMTRVGEDDKTIIHQLVEGAKANNASIRLLLVKYVLRKAPELMEKRDTNDRTPLHSSIANGRQVLLDFMLTDPMLKPRCIPILQKPSPKPSCLHDAITNKMEGCAAKMLELLEPDSVAFLFPDSERNTPLHLSVDPFLWSVWDTREQADERLRFIDTLLKKGRKALEAVNKANQTPLQYHLAKLEKLEKENHTEISGERFQLLQDEVHFKLLDACMHLEEVMDIKRVLYGTTGGKMISFNLSEVGFREERLPENFLERLNDHVNLERILKVVYLPNLVQHNPGGMAITTNPNRRDMDTMNSRGISGNSMSLGDVFEWLAEKDVWKIIKVIVRDDEDKPHGDEVIEKALKPFDVEILDWKKLDISSETILDAAPFVREVFLYTRGQRAVLRGWSAPDGLIQLEKLETIHIRVIRPIESNKQTMTYLDEFGERIKGLLGLKNSTSTDRIPPREIKIYWKFADSPPISTKNQLVAADIGRRVEETQSWLGVMEEFNKFVLNIKPDPQSPPAIRIAILDDGVDSFADDLLHKIKAGHSFCHSHTSTGMGESPHFCSVQGHGTAMAKLVCRVCRVVELVVLKLDGSHTGNPTALSAAEAINWVTSSMPKVYRDIISMSWSIPANNQNKHDIPDLERAIQEAHRKKILMFCSASDHGLDKHSFKLYPAACADKVFCIGAAKSTGQIDDRVGEQVIDFTIPGQVAIEDSPATPTSGSSAATALAAGLAGLILFLVGVSEQRKYFEKLHQKSYMETVLRRLTRTDHSSPEAKLLRIKEFFPEEYGRLDWDKNGQSKLEMLVTRLLRDVVEYEDRIQPRRVGTFENF